MIRVALLEVDGPRGEARYGTLNGNSKVDDTGSLTSSPMALLASISEENSMKAKTLWPGAESKSTFVLHGMEKLTVDIRFCNDFGSPDGAASLEVLSQAIE